MLTRFAPSPTGYLHVGNVRTALVCWMYTRNQNGKFLLRFDDTDLQRSDVKYINNIIEDLKWIGIDWDASFKQSE
ncbi:MAG: glutamate--tRNA ligase family protein, partial [Wolbachia sp.]